jgi:hypothetical protein
MLESITLNKSIFSFVVFLLYSAVSFGQACGSGTFHCKFIGSDYKTLTNLKYEFLPLKEDVFNNREFIDKHRRIQYGLALDEDEAKDFVANSSDVSKFRHLKNCLKKSDLDSIGTHNSNFEFYTLELLHHPLILKIQSDEENFYFLGDFFGGCTRQNVFVLDQTSLTIKSDMNFDGYSDFVNLTGVEQQGKTTFDVYLYDPSKKTYNYSEKHSESALEKSSSFYDGWNLSHLGHKIYSLNKSNYLIVQNFVSGNGNHYYDNITVSHISFSNRKIEYLPFGIQNEEFGSLKSEYGSIKIAQHQGFNYQDKMFVVYNETTKKIEIQFTEFNGISNTDNGKRISMKLEYIEDKFQSISEQTAPTKVN